MAEEKVEKKENEVGDAPAAPPVAADAHDDEDQDIELIKKMLVKYMGDGEYGPSEEECGVAKEAIEAYKEMGMDQKEAEEAAVHAVKLAKHMAKKGLSGAPSEPPAAPGEQPQQQEESEEVEESGDQPSPDKLKDEKQIEAMRQENLKLKGELASFKEAARKGELETYLEQKMAKTKMPTSVTKGFKESVKDLKSKEQIDASWEIYSAGIKAGGVVAKHINFNEAVSPEKQTAVGGKSFSFTGITKE
jgi:hypothetical protein